MRVQWLCIWLEAGTLLAIATGFVDTAEDWISIASDTELFGLISFVGLMVGWAALMLSGGALVVGALARVRNPASRRASLRLAAGTIAGGVLLFWLSSSLSSVGHSLAEAVGFSEWDAVLTRYQREIPSSRIAMARAAEATADDPRGAVSYRVFSTPPLLVAEVWRGDPSFGWWCGLVWDPTGGIESVIGEHREFSGGYSERLDECRQIEPSYHYCCFSNES